MHKVFVTSLFVASAALFPMAESPAQAQAVIRVDVAPPAPRVEVIPAAPSPRHVWMPGYWNWDGRVRQHVWIGGRYDFARPQMTWVPARWVQKWEYLPGHWARQPAGPVVGVAPVQPYPPQPVVVAQPVQPAYPPQPVAQPYPPQPVQPYPPQPVAQPYPPQPVVQPVAQPAYGPNDEYEIEVAPPPPQQEVIPVAPSPQHVWIAGYWRWDPMARRHAWMAGRYDLGRPGRAWVPAHWVQRGWRWRYMPGHWR